MSIAVLFAGIVVVVFVGAFLSSRRFGTLALSLAAGSILSGMWSSWLADLLSGYDIGFAWMPPGVLATGLLLLLPLMILLMSGPKYSGKSGRIFSSLAIGVLTAAFLVVPLGQYMSLEGDMLAVYRWLSGHWQYVVTAGLVFGVLDLVMLHGKKPVVSGKKH